MTTRACLSGDGKKIISANFLSANVSLIDRNTQTLENIPDIDNVWIVTPIPGSEDVLLSGRSAASTYLFDTKSATIEKTISVSQAWSVTVSQDRQFAYMIDITGMLFKIALEGENTHIVGYVDVDFYQNQLLIIDLINPMQSSITEIPAAGLPALTIFPNPASHYVSIAAPGVMKKIEVYDSAGKLIHQEIPGNFQVSVNVSKFTPGRYIVKATLEPEAGNLVSGCITGSFFTFRR